MPSLREFGPPLRRLGLDRSLIRGSNFMSRADPMNASAPRGGWRRDRRHREFGYRSLRFKAAGFDLSSITLRYSLAPPVSGNHPCSSSCSKYALVAAADSRWARRNWGKIFTGGSGTRASLPLLPSCLVKNSGSAGRWGRRCKEAEVGSSRFEVRG